MSIARLPFPLLLLGRSGEKLVAFTAQFSVDLVVEPVPFDTERCTLPPLEEMVLDLYAEGVRAGVLPSRTSPFTTLPRLLEALPWRLEELLDVLNDLEKAYSYSYYTTTLYLVHVAAAYKALTALGLTRASTLITCEHNMSTPWSVSGELARATSLMLVEAAKLKDGTPIPIYRRMVLAEARREPRKAAELIKTVTGFKQES